MDLSIIIVSWNIKEKLKENLNAIFNSSVIGQDLLLQYEVFVVDNNSADDTALMVKNEFPQVKLTANRENLGFSKANNQAIKEAQGEFILLLNPDMRIFPDTLLNMVRWIKKNKQAWVAGCRLINEKGEIIKHVRRFPSVWDQAAIILKLPHFFPSILENYIRHDFNYELASSVDSIRGGFFMIRRDIINKIGLLDERFFLWFEEVDYCQRVKKAGGEVWYTPEAKCVDFIGQSFKQVKRKNAQIYFRDSMLKYFKKWHPAWQYWLLKITWPIGIILLFFGEKINIENKANT